MKNVDIDAGYITNIGIKVWPYIHLSENTECTKENDLERYINLPRQVFSVVHHFLYYNKRQV